MTERFPRQRSHSAQHADNTAANGAESNDPVFDESFVAAAPAREPSAKDRAVKRHLQRHPVPDQRTDEIPVLPPVARWTIRPSHRFAALRLLPVAAAVACVIAVTALIVMLLR